MSEKYLKVLCPKNKKDDKDSCQGVLARIYGDNFVSIRRSQLKYQVFGKDYSFIIGCSECDSLTSIICSNSKIDLTKINFEEIDPSLIVNPEKNGEKPESKTSSEEK